MTLDLPRHDYVSPGFKLVRSDDACSEHGRRPVLLGLVRRNAAERVAAVKTQANAMSLGHVVTDDIMLRLLPRRLLIGLLRRSASATRLFLSQVLTINLSRRRGTTFTAIGQIVGGVPEFQSSAAMPPA